jgi:hypothetical protein
MFVPKGARIVMQVHYNLVNFDAGNPPPADRSKVALWTLESGQTPTQLVTITGFPHGGIQIPAGDSNVVQEKTFNIPPGATIIGAAPHMHLLGKAIKVVLERADGSEECIIDVPAWDFDWQQFYLFEPEDYFLTKVGDSLRLTCTYDNSSANQPYVNNVQVQPKDVSWGDGTFDEMCLNYVIALKPFTGVGSQTCPTLTTCISGCDPGDSDCFVSCLAQNGEKCSKCFLPNAGKCTAKHCPLQLKALSQCLDNCSGDACLFEECAEQFKAAYQCLEPYLKAGDCDAELIDCGVSFGAQ